MASFVLLGLSVFTASFIEFQSIKQNHVEKSVKAIKLFKLQNLISRLTLSRGPTPLRSMSR